ncbi:hypothetical protein TTHERM_00470690 (macronuclear) [Tetrahymena thermophila SB210]|uniref:Uncharacterized protein n=1 Tax=Tetrahymena thermophila (strain SB210) TaxID=312017 RepID=I7M6J0_TETTS|nr:hypothetical protein TTHERM_00470690 [Tetrahymena thermophila SB210]EAR85296.2 hypothetical protein TTHERM_00470690 [Tetrahymena thermophila SB210]|eukprot:XP_001032959.2 hypothetical protein TTHERM_00470690 [Tetrahymena thermophila SB210]
MEQELDKLMQEEIERSFNPDGEQSEINDQDDDDLMRQSVDLEIFEKKLSQQKRKQEYQNQLKAKQQQKQEVYMHENAVSSDESEEEDTQEIANNIKANQIKIKQDADSLYEELIQKGKLGKEQGSSLAKKPPTPNKLQIMQQQYAQSRDKEKQKQDEILEEILKSNNDGFKEKKLKELLQRNRNLNIQYEKEKAMRIKLESQLNQMIKDHEEFLQYKQGRLGDQGNNGNNNDAISVKSHSDSVYSAKTTKTTLKENSVMNSADTEDYKEKFQKTDKKLQEFRVQNNNLKNELNKALRVITREVGENVNIDKILLEENGWKGRAQQIEKLKAKVRDLQQKIGNISHTSINSDMSGFSSAGLGLTGQSHRGNSLGGQAASERRKEQEELKQQFDKIKQENELIGSKLKAVTARKNILEKEIKEIRNEYDNNKKILLDKSDNDNKYISALKQEIDKLRKKEPEVINKVVYQRVYTNNTDEENEKKLKASDDEMSRLRQDMKYMKNELEQKERMISELISEKIKSDKQQVQKVVQSSNLGNDEAHQKIQKLEEMVRALKKEREDFYDSKLNDKESAKIIKELSLQNAKLRSKIDDLNQQKK